MRRAGPVVWLAVAALVAAATPALAADAAAVTATAALERADGTALAPGDRLPMGEPATLVLTVTAPSDAKVFVPSNPEISPFRLLGKPTAPPQRTVQGPTTTEVHRVPVVALRVGAKAVPPIEIVYQTPDGASGTVRTERLRVRVSGRLENEQDPQLAAPPPPVPVIATNWVLVWSLSVFGAAVLATLLTLIGLRLLRARLEAAKPPPPPRPANEVALEALERLAVDVELPSDELHAATVDVLRAYLGGRYGFDGLEQTTHEMMHALDGEDLGAITRPEVRGLLEDADLVKFARLMPGLDEARALIPVARRIVEETWQPPEDDEAEAEAARPRLEPATAAERFKAGAVDVTLATALGMVALGGLWAFGLLDWGWLSVVLVGLVLSVRDLAGPGSPGKAIMGLRVVLRTERQGNPSLARRLGRNGLLLLAPVGLPVEALVLAYHPLRHRVGDLWSRTEVVRGGGPA